MTTTKSSTTTSKSTTMGRNAIGQHVATVIMDHVAKNVLQKWNPKTHGGITREQAIEAARQIFGYVSPNAWSYTDAHPFYGVRNVGRPAPKTSASASKSTARPGRGTASKTAASKTTPVKGAPKTTARAKSAPASKGATPATVARSASKSRTAPASA
jgi:hypothetical protein